ncbi:MAG: hypothetical protein P1U63_09870 [Coxiellaceae bacterium]|nr:hypothetical protein [Coxiellaceae bacterium]
MRPVTDPSPAHRGIEESKAEARPVRSTPVLTGGTTTASVRGDAMGITAGFIDMRSLAQLTITSKQFNRATQAELIRRRTEHALLDHIVKGEEKKAQAMLNANPELILAHTAKTIDYSGKSIEGLTAFQAALCAGDADMVQMMQPYFAALDGGGEQVALQIKTLFPDGFDAHLAHQLRATFDFSAIFDAISIASDDEVKNALALSGVEFKQSDTARSKADSALTLTEAMNRFRESFTNTSLREQTYNPQHLLQAIRLYASTFKAEILEDWLQDRRGRDLNWDKGRHDLFWRQVIGFCQRFVPACTAQAFAQGLDSVVTLPGRNWVVKPLQRNLMFQKDGCDVFYPIGVEKSGLGFDYASAKSGAGAGGYGRGQSGWVAWPRTFLRQFLDHVNILFQSKQQAFSTLYRATFPDEGSTPITTPTR